MSQLFRKFLADDGLRLPPGSGRFLALGAFGKHPGWDDHIEDLGLETETLALVRRLFYIEGVGRQIDTGAWEKLQPGQRLENFDHVFIWHRANQFLAGRIWSSSDGKGRTRYPMVVCAHWSGAPFSWGLEYVLPRLAEVERSCRETGSATEVRSILDRARAYLRGMLGQAATNVAVLPKAEVAEFLSSPAFGAQQLGWFRIIYHMQNRLASFGLGKFDARNNDDAGQHLRLPAGAASVKQVLELWNAFFQTRIDRQVPALLLVPAGQSWVDAIFGEPAPQDFFCLRALPSALPLMTDVPYELDEAFKARARRMLADFQSGDGLDTSEPPAVPEPAAGGWSSFTQRWFKSKGPDK